MNKKTPVLTRYLLTFGTFIVVLIVCLVINNTMLLRNLENSFRNRTQALVNNAYQYMEERWNIYFTSALTIDRDSTSASANIHRLHTYRNPYHFNFYGGARNLINTLRILQFSHAEIVDILIWHDQLDVFFNTSGTWSKDLLFHWENIERFSCIDFSWIHNNERNAVFYQQRNVVYYNNSHSNIHIFISLCPYALENMLSQLIPSNYGTFTVTTNDGIHLPISNGGQHISGEPDIVLSSNILPLTYRFYYNPSAYTEAFNQVMLNSIGIVTVITLVAIFTLYKIKKDLYDPLPKIINTLNTKAGNTRNEFALIMDSIDVLNTELENKNFYHAISANETEKLKDLVGTDTPWFCTLVILFEDDEGNKNSSQVKLFTKSLETFTSYPIFVIEKYNVYYFLFKDQAEYDALTQFVYSYIKEADGFCQCGISALHSDIAHISLAINEGLHAFNEIKSQGVDIEKSPKLYDGATSEGHLSVTNHNKLVADILKSDAKKIKETMLEIINENNAAGATVKRRLLLGMYDTVVMLTNRNGDTKANHLTDIFNLSLLYTKICDDLTVRLQPKAELETALEWVNANLHRNISLTDFAEAMDISYTYASALFKNKINMNFLEYLQKRRIEHSMHLLTTSDKSIEDIATSSGFISVKTFFRVFKKHAGVTPGAYRESLKGA